MQDVAVPDLRVVACDHARVDCALEVDAVLRLDFLQPEIRIHGRGLSLALALALAFEALAVVTIVALAIPEALATLASAFPNVSDVPVLPLAFAGLANPCRRRHVRLQGCMTDAFRVTVAPLALRTALGAPREAHCTEVPSITGGERPNGDSPGWQNGFAN